MRSQAEKRLHEGKRLILTAAILALGSSGACDAPSEELVGGSVAPPNVESRASAITFGMQFGWNFTTPGPDYNRCVKHAATVLNRMNGRGENIGIHYKSAGYTNTDGATWHAQSIVRLPFYEDKPLLKGQWFVEDIDHPIGGASNPDSQGHLGVARLDFTGGRSGRLLGSNKTFNDGLSGSDWLVAPNPGDSFVAVNGTKKFHVDEIQNHPGGMSGIGWHVAVALMQWAYHGAPFFDGYTTAGSVPIVKIFSHETPDRPVLKQTFTTFIDPTPGKPTGNDAVAITKVQDGRFLMAVLKGNNLKRLEFYISNGTSLDTPNVFGANGRAPDAMVQNFYPSWSSMNFITDCDSGQLFLLAFDGSDKIVSNLVQFFQNMTAIPPFVVFLSAPPNEDGLTAVATKPMSCRDNGTNYQCAFTSSAGSYVDPDGKVILYAMGGAGDGCLYSASGSECGGAVRGPPFLVHGNGRPTSGNFSASAGYMRGMEFHERHGNWAAGTSCPTMDTAWVEFYDSANFNSGATDVNKNYFIAGNDPLGKPTYSLGPNYFNDLATSVRWCLPPDKSLTVFSAVNFSGSSHVLSGTGAVQKISTFVNRTYRNGGAALNDSISSYRLNDTNTDPAGDLGVSDDSI